MQPAVILKSRNVCVSVINAYQASPPDTCPLLTALFVLSLTQTEAVDASQSVSTTQRKCKQTIVNTLVFLPVCLSGNKYSTGLGSKGLCGNMVMHFGIVNEFGGRRVTLVEPYLTTWICSKIIFRSISTGNEVFIVTRRSG